MVGGSLSFLVKFTYEWSSLYVTGWSKNIRRNNGQKIVFSLTRL